MFQTHSILDCSTAPATDQTSHLVSPTVPDSVKDAGRVRVGNGMLRFEDIKDSGRVRVGNGMLRF